MVKVKKILLILIISILFIIGIFLGLLTLTDYRPAPITEIEVQNKNSKLVLPKKEYSIYTWNIGYGSLGSTESFFLDDGAEVIPANKEIVSNFLSGIKKSITNFNPDFILFQEIDIKAKRSYFINQLNFIKQILMNYNFSFAKNYDVLYIPYPIPMLGEVEAGVGTFSKYSINESKRYSFEGNYKWPKNTVMLDRCFLVTRLKVNNRNQDLVIINAHFSAYDDGTLREKQLGKIKNYILEQYKLGHYVILGADWNQTFQSVKTEFPLYKNGQFYQPSIIPSKWVEDGWTLGISENAPTYRILNAPYQKGVTQVGIIDGFLVSPNVAINKVEVIDLEFKDSDHNPVKMIFSLK